MRKYTFRFSTDNELYREFCIENCRFDASFERFLRYIPSVCDFHRLEIFDYTVESNGKVQHRYLDCPHTYINVNNKCVRWYEEGIYWDI